MSDWYSRQAASDDEIVAKFPVSPTETLVDVELEGPASILGMTETVKWEHQWTVGEIQAKGGLDALVEAQYGKSVRYRVDPVEYTVVLQWPADKLSGKNWDGIEAVAVRKLAEQGVDVEGARLTRYSPAMNRPADAATNMATVNVRVPFRLFRKEKGDERQ